MEVWRPSRIEHDTIVVIKERQVKSKRGLHETEVIRFVQRAHPETYSKTEIADSLTVLAGKKFLQKQNFTQKMPSVKDRFTGKVIHLGQSHTVVLYTVSEKGILYLREMNGQSPEGPGVQLYTSTEPYSVRRLFEGMFQNATEQIRIIDNYIGRKTLDYLMSASSKKTPIKILTSDNKERGFDEALSEFVEEYGGQIDIRDKSGAFHGRLIIIDNQCYITDHSIKDFGAKPSSITKVEEPIMNDKYIELFTSSWD